MSKSQSKALLFGAASVVLGLAAAKFIKANVPVVRDFL